MADDGHNDGANGQGLYDPFLVPDDFDEYLNLMDMNGGMEDPPPLAAPQQNVVVAGPSGDNPIHIQWPATLDINSVGNSTAPTDNAHAAVPTSGAQNNGAGASVTAPPPPSSSSAVHQNGLDCTGCQVLREVLHCNGRHTYVLMHGTHKHGLPIDQTRLGLLSIDPPNF